MNEADLRAEARKIPLLARAMRTLLRIGPAYRLRRRMRGTRTMYRLHGYIDGWPERVIVQMRDGRYAELDLSVREYGVAYWDGEPEPYNRTEHILKEYVRPGDVVIDGGANVGLVATAAARLVGPSGQVHCFEPVSRSFEKLKRNSALNGLTNMTLNHTALGETTETATIFYAHSRPGRSSLKLWDDTIPPAHITAEPCPMVRLDDYIERHRLSSVRLVKLDIEGAEFAALRGAQRLLGEQHPFLLVELNRRAAASFGYHPHEMVRWLVEEFGYRPHRPLRGGVRPSAVEELPTQAQNVLLM